MNGLPPLLIDGQERPCGVDLASFRFDWSTQVAPLADHVRVELTDGSGAVVWHSAWAAPAPGFTRYDGPGLRPQARYTAHLVAAHDAPGGAGYPVARTEFVTALADDGWEARWISAPWEADLPGIPVVGPRERQAPPEPSREPRPVPEFVRSFEVAFDESATYVLRATAVGVSEVLLNGRAISAEILSPGWTDIASTLIYQSVDVTDLVRAGDNELRVRVGDGWAVGHIAWFGTGHYARQRAALVQLEQITASSGRVIVSTDGQWSSRRAPISYADLQNGSDVVVGRERGHAEPESEGVVVVRPAVGRLVGRLAPPIVPIRRLPAREVTKLGDELVVDFAQNIAGWVEIDLPGHDGATVEVRHAEAADATGALYTESLRSTQASDRYTFTTSPVGPTALRPAFTVHGFRRASVTGLADAAGAVFTAVAVSADLPETATFACSDPDLDRLHENVLWSARANFLSVPTDCPQRDERLGWTGDAQVFAPTAALNFRVLEFFRKWLGDVRDATGADGAVPHVAPDVLSTSLAGEHVGAAGWGDAIALVPWAMYQAYGDTAVLHENLAAMDAWLAYLDAHSDNGIRPAEGFGDWLAFDETPVDLVSTAFFAHTAEIAARCAGAVGDAREARWRDLSRRVGAAFCDRFLPDGVLTAPTQAAHVLALQFGLVPAAHRARVENALVASVTATGHLTTGFLATPYLLPALTAAGREDVAMDLLLHDGVPSWLYPVRHGGATTMWERWDSWTNDAGFADPAMNSFNHYAYGAVDEWMCGRIGGIEPTAPGHASVEISPLLDPRLDWAEHSRSTPYGAVAVRWERSGSLAEITITVPRGMAAGFRLPNGHTFVSDAPPAPLPAGTTRVVVRRMG